MAKDRVGIVGPGRMGLAMLKHLKKHGFEVTAYDINDERKTQLPCIVLCRQHHALWLYCPLHTCNIDTHTNK